MDDIITGQDCRFLPALIPLKLARGSAVEKRKKKKPVHDVGASNFGGADPHAIIILLYNETVIAYD